MTKYTFTYFPGRGRGELSRLIFHQAGVQFEDKRISMEEWPAMKPTIPNNCLPALQVDDKYLGESMAIARYLANEFHLSGQNNWEKGLCDMYVDIVQDLYNGYDGALHAALDGDNKKMAEEWAKFQQGALPKLLPKFEKPLGENKNGWLVGDKCTWADLHLAQLIEVFQSVYHLDLSAYPHVKAHVDKVFNLPNIKKYAATRPNSTW